MLQVPQFAQLGKVFRTLPPVELTEPETEYVVKVVKHLFDNHVVFQFNCTNTVNDQLLEKVCVATVASNPGWKAVLQIPLEKLAYGETASCFVCYEIPEELDAACTGAAFSCTLKFVVKDCDPSTGEPDDTEGYPDEYVLEDVQLALADHVLKVANVDFAGSWEDLGPESELEDTFVLSTYSSLQQAIQSIQGFLGMHACERSDQVAEGKSTHTLFLSGVFRGGAKILVRARLALGLGGEPGVTMSMTVRSSDSTVPELILTSVG